MSVIRITKSVYEVDDAFLERVSAAIRDHVLAFSFGCVSCKQGKSCLLEKLQDEIADFRKQEPRL